ncbi:hypothetical protein JZ751_000718 [Albula glossodonta]|uniref:Uncharacterized protein n=1 Tax=Albula glossodonta TaxID=121402 RepID=A0A8T2PWZ5_9TELE|nr:hypothetical protein JZ751_000718 [Albula glossodonta]
MESDGGEKAFIVDTQTVLTAGTENVAEKHRTKHSVWDDGGLDAVLKSEPEIDAVNLQDTGSEHTDGKQNGLSYEACQFTQSYSFAILMKELLVKQSKETSDYSHGREAIQLHTVWEEVYPVKLSYSTSESPYWGETLWLHSVWQELTSIMEVLAKAAVTEICQLVDDGYAVLRLEISRSEKENQTLKRKLQMLELMIARGYAETGQRESPATNCRPDTAQACDESSGTETAFGSQLSDSLWREAEPTTVDEEDAAIPSPTRMECADIEEGRSQSLLIKEETLEEDLESNDSQGGLRIRQESK